MIRYQETWVKGASTGAEHQRSCADRYEPIKEFVSQYSRRISVFDLGANLGYFSLRIMEDADAVCIMADNREELRGVLQENAAPGAVWLNTRLYAKQLGLLGRSECFDVVLALSVLHHFDIDWIAALGALRSLGQYVIAELPAEDDHGALNGSVGRAMRAHVEDIEGARLLAEFPSHTSGKPRPMFLIPGLWFDSITLQAIDAVERKSPVLKSVFIDSSFSHKHITIHHGDVTGAVEERDFYHGINLWNFLLLGGAWPAQTRSLVINWLRESKGWHDDLRPWNFILGGDRVHAIDTNSKAWRTRPEPGAVQKCLDMIDKRCA